MESQEQRARGEKFRSLHAGPDLLLLPNAWDGGSAVLMEKAGFQAIATTSSGIAFAQGRPDGERIGRARMLEVVARIAERVSIPVSADLETGYGDSPEDVAETIRQAIAAGAVGANVEDGTTDGIAPLLPLERAVERLRAARAAADAGGVPFVLNGRTDPYLRLRDASPEERFAETVRRAHAYQEAGADCIFVPGVADAATIGRLVREIGPINVLGAFSGVAAPALSELRRLGVRRVTIGGSVAQYAWSAARRALEEIRTAGTFSYAAEAISHAEMNRLMS